jgi:hypothetical protein
MAGTLAALTTPVQSSELSPTSQVNTSFAEFYQVLFGPRFNARLGRTNPFAHELIGFETARSGGFLSPSRTNSHLAFGFGGGLDVEVGERVAIREFNSIGFPSSSLGAGEPLPSDWALAWCFPLVASRARIEGHPSQ